MLNGCVVCIGVRFHNTAFERHMYRGRFCFMGFREISLMHKNIGKGAGSSVISLKNIKEFEHVA
jgi:hypothetical protein